MVSVSPIPSFQVAARSVVFAGSRRGAPAADIPTRLVHVFGTLGFGFLTGCAAGVDAAFRSALAASRFGSKSFVACAFDSRIRRNRLAAGRVVPDGLSPAAALHRRTVWLVRRASVLVLFPDDPATGRWGCGSTLAYRTARYNLVPVFVASSHRPTAGPGYHVVQATLFGIVPGFWVYPHPVREGGACEDAW